MAEMLIKVGLVKEPLASASFAILVEKGEQDDLILLESNDAYIANAAKQSLPRAYY